MEKRNRWLKELRHFDEGGALIALLALCAVVGIINPVFFTPKNIINVLRQFSFIGIVAVGGAFVIISGGIDLSVGSQMSFGAVSFAWLCSLGVEPVIAFVLVLVAGLVIGSINGLGVVKIHLNPFIVTLGMSYIVKGVTMLITGGIPIKFENYMSWMGGQWYDIPVSIYFMLTVMIVGFVVLSKTGYGRKVYAVGGNKRAAKLSGIKVGSVQISVYAVTGMLACFAGMVSCANLGSGDVATGAQMEMNVITACVLGGITLEGGRGSIIGAFIGAAIIGVIKNGFILLRIPSAWQTVALGGFLVLACAIDQLKRKEG